MKLKSLEIDSRKAALAPMAGVADRAFRELCVKYGSGYAVSEMVSSKGLTMGDRKSKELLFISDNERPAAAQIFGTDPKIMAESARSCLSFHPDVIDINMGCPAPKISSGGAGASLMKNPALARDIMTAVRRAVDIPVTVKMRTGWDESSLNCIELSKIAEDCGIDAITIHGRTKEQMYAPPINTKIIAEVKKNVSIPVIANGDITDGPSAAKMIEETNCDMVMVGRGALGRPWVFSQIEAYLKHEVILPEPPVSERMRVMLGHIKTICKYKGERIGMREARKHAAWYIKGIRGAAAYRQKMVSVSSFEELEELAFRITFENE